MRRLTVALLALASAGGALPTAQTAQIPAPQEPAATFRSSVEAVQISVIVTDEQGRPVAGLTADDFEVVEGQEARPITTFAAVDIPVERTERTSSDFDVVGNDRHLAGCS